ncbi:MAG: aminotransferase class I/II-fold pyridoxal phosphate-dependent enzyme [Bacteroidales bacterium]|nr:aminotransferase class I/II-fold pyridoxal phosphate-dependent enzyme [Bacteroidales bacterium]
MGNSLIENAFSAIEFAKVHGFGHISTRKDSNSPDKRIIIKGEKFVTFSLSDYLMLMHDERIKNGAIEAIKNNGFNLSISREYMRMELTDQAEDILSKVFGNPVVLYPKTTLAHIGAIPLLIEKNDAVIFDHHAHSTMGMAVEMIRARGTHVEIVRHNNLEQLEDKIKELRKTYKKIWYLADGVYSMHGDVFPAKEIEKLLDIYEEFYVYVDDAHGVSWVGPNGAGYVLSQIKQHPKMILAVSFGKGFGAGGGAIVCPNEEMKKLLVYLSGPLMFTGPLESSTLGGLIASSKIHLSNEIVVLQKKLANLLDYFYDKVEEMGLPLADHTRTPTAYFPGGRPETMFEIGKFIFDNHMTCTAGLYPAVAINNAGIRIQITLYQEKSDIDNLLQAIQDGYAYLSKEKGISIEDILKRFK